jgi:hypothetical protein
VRQAGPTGSPDRLRAEHDALAARLAARRSIELARRAVYAGFAAFISGGLAAKLAFDVWLSTRPGRFQGPAVFCFVALAVSVVLLAVTVAVARRARRHMREEDVAFSHMRRLRETLGLDS